MINKVILTGRIAQDLELKSTTNNVSVLSFSLAVARPYSNGNEKITDFFNIVAWRKTAEFIAKFFKKGDMIGLVGQLQTRKFTGKNGEIRTVYEVITEDAHFLERKSTENKKQDIENEENNEESFSDYITMPDNDMGEDLPF